MSDDQFTKLFKYMNERFGKTDARLDELQASIGRVYDLVDQDLKEREINEQERLVMAHQLDRHESWIKKAGKKLDIRYGV